MWTPVEKTFPAEKTCNYQGSFAHFSASNHAATSSSTQVHVKRMLTGMTGFEIRSENVPDARTAAGSLPWVRDDTFLQGAAWREGLGRYERFVRERGDGRVLLLELGVGEMTPRHHHAPVLEYDRKAAGCAPVERKHLRAARHHCSLEARQRQSGADLGALLSAARAAKVFKPPCQSL